MPPELERLMLRPITLIALALWALNDHYLKAAWANVFTGKLSDVTSLMVAPIVLAFASAALRIGRSDVRLLLSFWCALLALVMVAIKVSEPAADVYRIGLALLQWPFRCVLSCELVRLAPVSLAMDPSDILTIPAALVPLWLLERELARSEPGSRASSPARS